MIYVKRDKSFNNNYNFFTWAMTVVLEDLKGQRELNFTVQEATAIELRNLLHEWINKTQDTLASHGITSQYVHTNDNAGPDDFIVYFTSNTKAIKPRGDGDYTFNRVFVSP